MSPVIPLCDRGHIQNRKNPMYSWYLMEEQSDPISRDTTRRETVHQDTFHQDAPYGDSPRHEARRHRSRDYSRLVLLTLFLTSGIFGFLRRVLPLWRRPPFQGEPLPPGAILAGAGAILSWYILELRQFLGPGYDTDLRDTSRASLGFFTRVLPFLLVLGIYPAVASGILPTAVTVTIFFAVIAFSLPLSITISLLVLGGHFLWDGLAGVGLARVDRGGLQDVIFTIYRVTNAMLIFFIAFFWKEDRLRWQENLELTGKLREAQQRLSRYAERIADVVVLEERTRLARDIHDSIGHTLTAATVQLNKAMAFIDRDPDTARNAIDASRETLREGMRDIRSVLSTLNQEAEELDFFREIRTLAQRIQRADVTVDLSLEGDPRGYNKAVLMAIYRMAQEGFTNAVRHGTPSRIGLTITLGDESARVTIEDDGGGFSPEPLLEENRRGGLTYLQERIELVQGAFSVSSTPGRGSVLRAELPREPVRHLGERSRE